MDGTLLGADGRPPEQLWSQLEQMRRAGIGFAPASGRPYSTLREIFISDAPQPADGPAYAHGMAFICHNGGFVVRDDATISVNPIAAQVVRDIVEATRRMDADDSVDAGIIVCGAYGSRVERGDERFLREVRKYYSHLEVVDDVLDFDLSGGDDFTGPIVKLSAYAFSALPPLEHAYEEVTGPAGCRALVSGQNWIDIMRDDTDKGVALRALQRELGVSRESTLAFGDFPNDLGMLGSAGVSVAMANAHPDVLKAADFVAPPNTQGGVSQVIAQVLRDQGM